MAAGTGGGPDAGRRRDGSERRLEQQHGPGTTDGYEAAAFEPDPEEDFSEEELFGEVLLSPDDELDELSDDDFSFEPAFSLEPDVSFEPESPDDSDDVGALVSLAAVDSLAAGRLSFL
jgi:hypothetical protein